MEATQRTANESRSADMRAQGNRPWRLMSFHKAADAPSNSINSLAPAE